MFEPAQRIITLLQDQSPALCHPQFKAAYEAILDGLDREVLPQFADFVGEAGVDSDFLHIVGHLFSFYVEDGRLFCESRLNADEPQVWDGTKWTDEEECGHDWHHGVGEEDHCPECGDCPDDD